MIPQFKRLSLPESKLHDFYSILSCFQIVMIFLIFHECFSAFYKFLQNFQDLKEAGSYQFSLSNRDNSLI